MMVNIPVYVATRRADERKLYHVRPVFFDGPESQHERLDQALSSFEKKIEKHLAVIADDDRHEDLAAWLFNPTLTLHRAQVEIDLRKQISRLRLSFVWFRHHGKAIAMCPELPEVWFDCTTIDVLPLRASEVLTAHFVTQQQEQREAISHGEEFHGVVLEDFKPADSASLMLVTVIVRFPSAKPKKTSFAQMIGEVEPLDGRSELAKVGECLDRIDPDRREQALHREPEIAQLTQRLFHGEGVPILLIGPRLVGKTCLIHEVVNRTLPGKQRTNRRSGEFWHIAPARLISGMSYVGQWEQRLLAILKHAQRQQHILVFDDLLGLFRAGQDSETMNVAMVLKPYLERRDVRILAEITPDAFRVLQEIDRGFADLFERLPITEPDVVTSRRILFGVQRNLEQRHGCPFELDALPTAIELAARADRTTAMPGKAARLLQRMAVKFNHSREAIDRSKIQAEFEAQTGMQPRFFDLRFPYPVDTIRQELLHRVFGQPEAVNTMVDLVSLMRSRLNDPGRPAASILLMGPTGVGKTECACASAEVLFGDRNRMIRIDLNEFGEPGSAARLVGTLGQPEGLLTSAIRRQPFAIILLDEIEKADPDVFDVLLQVLGEGRLTDALGRTADFSNAMILMTSNLGVQQAESRYGFSPESGVDRAAAYVRAAQATFRPEFYNRIDRIVPFSRLERDQVRRIANRIIEEVFSREGFRQRRAMLRVNPEANERIVSAGYEPTLGARALKRAIERYLTAPIAERLAELPTDQVTLMELLPGSGPTGDGVTPSLRVVVRALEEVPRLPMPPTPPTRSLDRSSRIRRMIRMLEPRITALMPTNSGSMITRTPEADHYYQLRELLDGIRASLRELDSQSDEYELKGPRPRTIPVRSRVGAFRYGNHNNSPSTKLLCSTEDFAQSLRELAAETPEPTDTEWRDLEYRLALLQLMAQPVNNGEPDSWVICIRVDQSSKLYARYMPDIRQVIMDVCQKQFQLMSHLLPNKDSRSSLGTWIDRAIGILGPHAGTIARLLEGLMLWVRSAASILPIPVIVYPVAVGQSIEAAIADAYAKEAAYQQVLKYPADSLPIDPFPLGPITRIISESGECIDCRTGIIALSLDYENLSQMLFAALPPVILPDDEEE